MIVTATQTAQPTLEPATVSVVLRTVESEQDRMDLNAMIVLTGTEVGVDPYQTGPPTYWIIDVEGEPVGYTGVHSIDFKSRRCRGIIWVHPDHRRHGVATEAVRLRNHLLFDQWNMNRIEWAVSLSNRTSRLFSDARSYAKLEGVLEEAVYYDGKYHDVALYALTRRTRDLMLDKRNDFTNPGQGEP